jgi:hypothetical protein
MDLREAAESLLTVVLLLDNRSPLPSERIIVSPYNFDPEGRNGEGRLAATYSLSRIQPCEPDATP